MNNIDSFKKPPTRIKDLIAMSGKKIKQISKETGIAYPTLTSYNQGVRNPKKENAKILADYFGVSVPYLLGLDSQGEDSRWEVMYLLKQVDLLVLIFGTEFYPFQTDFGLTMFDAYFDSQPNQALLYEAVRTILGKANHLQELRESVRFVWSEVTESPQVMIPKPLLRQIIACYNRLCDHHRLNNVKGKLT